MWNVVVTKSFNDGDVACGAAAVWVKALHIEAVLGVCSQVGDDGATCCYIIDNQSLIVCRVILSVVDQETFNQFTLARLILSYTITAQHAVVYTINSLLTLTCHTCLYLCSTNHIPSTKPQFLRNMQIFFNLMLLACQDISLTGKAWWTVMEDEWAWCWVWTWRDVVAV